MHAEIVMIGSELLLGEIVDTNAAKLATMLREIGLDLYYKTTVGDNEDRITEVLNLALERSDLVITSGGLGPTADDITRQAAARATGRRLVYSRELVEQIAARFRSFGRRMTENNKRQAYLPEGAQALPNPVGTAPCFASEDVTGRGLVICLPGVPRELEYMMTHTVLPLLVERMGGTQILKVRILRTCAVGESNVDLVLGDLMQGRNPTVGLAAHAGQTDIRITAKAATEEQALQLIAPLEATVRERLGVAIYGVEQESVAEVTGRLLSDRNLLLGVLDMMTGGQLASELIQAGYQDLVEINLRPASLSQALESQRITYRTDDDPLQVAAKLAASVAQEDGVGLAVVDAAHGESTVIAVHGPGDARLAVTSRPYRQDSDYVRRWLTIQGLDWLRRALLGQLTSPADSQSV